ncbi:MAG: ribosome small subunit-dependent GTPase A [Solirubrobacterales bacterium]
MNGTIVKGIAGFYYVKTPDNELIECKARGRFRFNELTPMVGDVVEITVKNDKGVIDKVLPRKSKLTRPAVANITHALVVFAFKNPDINVDLLNRFLILCEYNNLKITICLNKSDLRDEKNDEIIDMLSHTGYDIIFVNATSGIGVDEIKKRLNNNITVLCGPSGAGKSTILNSIAGRELMETGNVSVKLGRGKHTTRHSELIQIENGFIVDTPGFSSLEIENIEKEQLQYYFPEFDKYIGNCRFNGCIHHKEPGCKIKEALNNGEINKIRYDFYIKLIEEISDTRRKKYD